MKKIIAISTIVLSSIGFAAAATPTKPAKPIQSWTCQDFLDVNETYQPTAVSLIQLINEKKDTDHAYLDVNGIETMTPSLLDVCKENPKAPIKKAYQKAKAANHKAAK